MDGNSRSASQTCVATTTIRPIAPSSCRTKAGRLRRKTRIADPTKSTPAGMRATRLSGGPNSRSASTGPWQAGHVSTNPAPHHHDLSGYTMHLPLRETQCGHARARGCCLAYARLEFPPNSNNTGNFQLSNVDAVGVSPAGNRFPSQRVAFCGTDILSFDSEYKSPFKTMVGRYGSW